MHYLLSWRSFCLQVWEANQFCSLNRQLVKRLHPSRLGTGYPVNLTLTVTGVPTGKSIAWEAVAGAYAVDFSDGTDKASGTETTRLVFSADYTLKSTPAKIEIAVDGVVLEAAEFKVRAPSTLTSTAGANTVFGDGYKRNTYPPRIMVIAEVRSAFCSIFGRRYDD